MDTEAALVAVIVLNWNGLDDTLECLPTILAQSHPRCEVHVVDNGSDNDEADRIEAEFGDRITLHRNATNRGFTGGNNQVMQEVLDAGKAEFVALLNNDTVVEPDWVASLVEAAAKDPQAGMFASRMMFYADRDIVENTGILVLTTGEAMPRDRGLPRDRAHDAQGDGKPPIGACGGAVLLRTKMLREIGLFRDEFFANFEDVDLSLRALALGWEIGYAKDAVVYHKLGRSIRKIRGEEFLLRSQNNLLSAYWINLPWQVIVLNIPWQIIGHIALIVLSPLCGQRVMGRVIWKSRLTFWRNRRQTLAARRELASRRRGSWLSIWWRQTGFLPAYIRSFLAVVVLRKRRFFE